MRPSVFHHGFPRPALLRARDRACPLAGCSGDDAEGLPPDLPTEDLHARGQGLVAEVGREPRSRRGGRAPASLFAVGDPWPDHGGVLLVRGQPVRGSVAASERFIELHPGNKDVAYAYYRWASHYEQISDVGRDQEMTQRSQEAFDELIRRFPESDYSQDAELKVDLVRDHLAGEMEIGRYYQRREFWLASINRFRQWSSSTRPPPTCPGAASAGRELSGVGHDRGGAASAAVLGYNYPGNDWYQRSYALLAGPAARAEGRPVAQPPVLSRRPGRQADAQEPGHP